MLFGEIDRLRLGLIEDAFDFLTYRAVPDGRVKIFVWDGYIEEEAHEPQAIQETSISQDWRENEERRASVYPPKP